MSDMQTIIDGMTDDQKAEFGDRFLRTWSDHGFGTLSKRDTELLLFSCLTEVIGEGLPRTNYDWARALRITPARVRNLRRDAYMRFGSLLDADQGVALLRRCLANVTTMQVDLSGNGTGSVQIVADDPVIELELEPRLKALGGYYEYGRNRELLQIPLPSFVAVVDTVLGVDSEETFVAVMERVLQDQRARGAVDRELASKAWADKSEGGKILHFLKFLAHTFAEKPTKLVEYLEPIMGSHKYQIAKP